MTSTVVPSLDLSTLPEGVSATFTSSCAWGCVVRTVDGQEQPHICVGEHVLSTLAPELTFARVREIADGMAPLVRDLKGDAWEAGVRDGRTGPCYGVDLVGDVTPAEAERQVAEQLRATLAELERES